MLSALKIQTTRRYLVTDVAENSGAQSSERQNAARFVNLSHGRCHYTIEVNANISASKGTRNACARLLFVGLRCSAAHFHKKDNDTTYTLKLTQSMKPKSPHSTGPIQTHVHTCAGARKHRASTRACTWIYWVIFVFCLACEVFGWKIQAAGPLFRQLWSRQLGLPRRPAHGAPVCRATC